MAIGGTRVDVGTDTNALLRGLLEREHAMGDGHAMSLYLNLDPREFATPAARQGEVTSVLDEAARQAPDREWKKIIESIRGRFSGEDFEVEDAHGLAIIADHAGEVEVLQLRRPVRRRVVFGEHPYLRPLLETMPRTGWGVMLVNSRMARILLGSHDELHVVRALRDDVHGRHDQGGWSQARFERGIEEEIKDHVRRAAKELFPLHQAGLFRQLLASGPEEIRPLFEQALHSYIKPAFVGWIDLDVEHCSAEDVYRVALPRIEEWERHEQETLLERLREAIGTDGRGTNGLTPVLDALNEQRADTLLLGEGFSAAGVRCRSCGWLGVAGSTCPVDEGELCAEEDIVECAVEKALLQSASVVNVGRDTPSVNGYHAVAPDILDPATAERRAVWLELEGLGSIAALLRY